ncbi:MAG: hypothetical protein LUE13_03130 [Akkermansiaceae bacterium]|nr:hypothetical protein [Akkermansiaceae bacterium]
MFMAALTLKNIGFGAAEVVVFARQAFDGGAAVVAGRRYGAPDHWPSPAGVKRKGAAPLREAAPGKEKPVFI